MTFAVDVHLETPFDLGAVTAQIDLEGGGVVEATLATGRLVTECTRRPLALRLRGDDDERRTDGPAPPLPASGSVDLAQLFTVGVALPADGRLHARLVLLPPCQEAAPQTQAALPKLRFEPAEHSLCAAFVGREAAIDGAAELRFGERVAPAFDARLPVGTQRLTFGEIVALAGDFYADLDAPARQAFDWAWPQVPALYDFRKVSLAEDDDAQVARLQELIRREPGEAGLAEQFAAGALDALAGYASARCAVLAAYNHCHFACPESGAAGNPALRLYRAYHQRALAEARAAAERYGAEAEDGLRAALAADAFGCHFLTDLFASGHLRVPRRLLQEQGGTLIGGRRSHRMHQEDNARGLWVTTLVPSRPRVVWQALGDARLRDAPLHLAQVQEAVRRSAGEVFATWCGEPWPQQHAAEALLPVALAPGEQLRHSDVLPDGSVAPADASPNHWPLFWFSSEGRVLRRVGAGALGEYQVLGGMSPWQTVEGTLTLTALT